MNTFQNLIDNGIDPYTAQSMLDDYSKRVGTMNGIYEITDIVVYVTDHDIVNGCLSLYQRYKETRYIPIDLIKEWRVA